MVYTRIRTLLVRGEAWCRLSVGTMRPTPLREILKADMDPTHACGREPYTTC